MHNTASLERLLVIRRTVWRTDPGMAAPRNDVPLPAVFRTFVLSGFIVNWGFTPSQAVQ